MPIAIRRLIGRCRRIGMLLWVSCRTSSQLIRRSHGEKRVGRKDVVPSPELIDLRAHDRPIVPSAVKVDGHRRAPSDGDHGLDRVKKSRSRSGDGGHADPDMELQKHEEHKCPRIAPLKARTKAGHLHFFIGRRPISG